ncbi:HAD family phosphatase [Clostridium niameyense]|uniref:HAD family phosphatase n=1 Tax=Clostridium niameyense TaxID=1622073 RepID=A0A6M0RCY4_9CLOT|nr:HAD family phosphatase [Clostridium niameyense]NEZ47667.1 HAD family phosphatase [Clostridium niameyense]
MNNLKAAIFDLDGTLIDSMDIWNKIDTDFLTKRNLKVPINLKEEIETLTFEEGATYFKNRFKLTESIEEILEEWNNMAYKEYAHNINLKKGAKNFLNLLKYRGIKIAIATSNTTPLVNAVLKNNNILNLFDVITTIDEVSRGKDFPDIYLLTSKKLNIDPKNCIVFEDILPALKGAKAAGMKVVAVYDTYSSKCKKQMESLADLYINDYDEIQTII